MDSALANYNENSVYDTHKDRKFKGRELYGGSASTLDYYPYERVEFEDNPLLKEAKTMYLNAGSGVIGNIDKYLEIAKNNGVNAIVVDIKDGALAYTSEVAKEYSMTAYNTAINENGVYKAAIDKIIVKLAKDAGMSITDEDRNTVNELFADEERLESYAKSGVDIGIAKQIYYDDYLISDYIEKLETEVTYEETLAYIKTLYG